MSAAFASRSSQRGSVTSAQGPTPGSYDPFANNTLGAQALKTRNKAVGSFGASVRNLDWGKKAGPSYAPEGLTSAETAEVPSTFGAKSARASTKSRGPTLASGGSRFAPAKEASAGDYYVPAALGASKSYNGNRRPSMFGTMGASKRFSEVKISAAGDYSDARPGAFTKSKSSTKANTGFGGMSSRVTAFDEASKRATESASSHLSYNVNTSAFAKATEASTGASAAFASKSTQRSEMAMSDGPSAMSYNPSTVGSMAASANKSFNKSLANGAGGFGSSAKRCSMTDVTAARTEDVPGPGEYAPSVVDISDDVRPSSAFASTTQKIAHVRASEAPSSFDYDAHTSDGMAAVATKSFNKKAGTGQFGSRAARQTHDTKDTPGPGEYKHADPARPTVKSAAAATKGKQSGVFASTTLRDTAEWTGGNARGHSGFLP